MPDADEIIGKIHRVKTKQSVLTHHWLLFVSVFTIQWEKCYRPRGMQDEDLL